METDSPTAPDPWGVNAIREETAALKRTSERLSDDDDWYTLEQYGPDDVLASPVIDVNGDLMVMRGYDNTVGMARFILEDDELDHLPALGILAHDHDPSTDESPDDDRQSWSCGWVQKRDGEITVHEGVTEDDADLWDWLYGIVSIPPSL